MTGERPQGEEGILSEECVMQPYANRSGNSGVRAYECAADSISVKFSDGSVYLYTYASCGAGHCEQMKGLAASGSGLNSFINRHVRRGYAARLR